MTEALSQQTWDEAETGVFISPPLPAHPAHLFIAMPAMHVRLESDTIHHRLCDIPAADFGRIIAAKKGADVLLSPFKQAPAQDAIRRQAQAVACAHRGRTWH